MITKSQREKRQLNHVNRCQNKALQGLSSKEVIISVWQLWYDSNEIGNYLKMSFENLFLFTFGIATVYVECRSDNHHVTRTILDNNKYQVFVLSDKV